MTRWQAHRMARVATYVVAVALLTLPSVAHAWGPKGHQLVGSVADQLLNPNAKAQVTALTGFALKTASNWADCAKDVRVGANGAHYVPTPAYHATCQAFETPAGIAAMEDFVRRNTNNCNRSKGADICHKQYHYTDVSIVHDRYDRKFIGTSDHDIVAAIAAAIAVLKGKPAPAPFDIKDKREAVLVLAHLVGDIHQPLHVGSVYLTAAGQPIDPESAVPFDPKTETRGGNSIDVGQTNLHADWDAVSNPLTAQQVEKLAIKARQVPASKGKTSSWPKKWATSTVVASQEAFSGVSFTPSAANPGHWVARFDDRSAYLDAKHALQDQQMAAAGARLAAVFNAIWH
jgi:S1/P1 Nuclease